MKQDNIISICVSSCGDLLVSIDCEFVISSILNSQHGQKCCTLPQAQWKLIGSTHNLGGNASAGQALVCCVCAAGGRLI